MIKKIREFWSASFRSDPVAFWFEMTSFIFTVAASLTLAFTARNPDMSLIYPGFFIGSIAGVYGYWRRQLAWPTLLTAYFAAVNVLGFGRAVNWW